MIRKAMGGAGSKPLPFGMSGFGGLTVVLVPGRRRRLLDRAFGCEDEEAVERHGEPAIVGDGEDRALEASVTMARQAGESRRTPHRRHVIVTAGTRPILEGRRPLRDQAGTRGAWN